MRLHLVIAATSLVLVSAMAVQAEQSLPSEQQQKATSALKNAGYSKWDEIGMAEGKIKVDNAVDAQGKKFDLELDPKTMDEGVAS